VTVIQIIRFAGEEEAQALIAIQTNAAQRNLRSEHISQQVGAHQTVSLAALGGFQQDNQAGEISGRGP